jgi:hypothetical protein
LSAGAPLATKVLKTMAVKLDVQHFLPCAALLAPSTSSAAAVPAFEAGEIVEARAVQAGGEVLLADGPASRWSASPCRVLGSR